MCSSGKTILLANPTKVAPVRHHPALPWADAPAFMRQLREREGMSARALEFTIYTAARSNESRGMAWSELDRPQQLWTVPAERMKAGREHRVPLPTLAMELLDNLERIGELIVWLCSPAVQRSDANLKAALTNYLLEGRVRRSLVSNPATTPAPGAADSCEAKYEIV